jgi:uncharacterized protein YjbJ (UPF0337 family)
MGKSQPLKDIGQFLEGSVRNTVGKLTGIAQYEQAGRERQAEWNKSQKTAVYQKYKASDIEAFAQMGSELTGKTKAELEAAKPVSHTETKDVSHKGWQGRGGQYKKKLREGVEQEYADMAAGQRDRIQGLYKTSHARLGAIEQGRLRPGAKKQTVLTKRKY